MSNIFFSQQADAGRINQALMSLVRRLSYVRPNFQFVFTGMQSCLVYRGNPDLTGKDISSVNYIGAVHVAGMSYRGGKGPRASLVCVPYGKPKNAATPSVVEDKLFKECLDKFVPRTPEEVVNAKLSEVDRRVQRMYTQQRELIRNELIRSFSARSNTQLTDDLAGAAALSATEALRDQKVARAASGLRYLLDVFGDAGERLACVVVVNGTYYVHAGGSIAAYAATGMPPHIARAVGMLKVMEEFEVLHPGHGIKFSSTVFAVSAEEVGV